jgi:hypothetical protein
MELVIIRKNENNLKSDEPKTPEERLNLLEILRIEAGNFLYEYPKTFRRVVNIIRKK